MIKGYNCTTCGGNLSHEEGSFYYICKFCGKIYTEDLSEINVKTVRFLRARKRIQEAKAHLNLLMKEDPENFVYIWEMLNCSLSPDPVSMYLSQKSHNLKLLKSLLENQWYRKLKKTLPYREKGYTDEIEEYISVCEEISDLEYKLDKTKKSHRAYSRDNLDAYELDYDNRNNAFAAWAIMGGVIGALVVAAICEEMEMMNRLPLFLGIFLSVHYGLVIGIKVTEKTRAYKKRKNALERMKGEIGSYRQVLTDKRRRAEDLIKSIKRTEKELMSYTDEDREENVISR